MNKTASILFFILMLGITISAKAQSTLKKDFSYTMEIPSLVALNSSSAHFYGLSESKGLAVFRAHPDSLQWLYTSSGMQKRGHTITADIRFAYMFGDGRRLTVLEPTSLLGVYSATMMPDKPRDAKRIGQQLYVALGKKGVGIVSLKSPEAVDSTLTYAKPSTFNNKKVLDLEASNTQLFVLANDGVLVQLKKDKKNSELSIVSKQNLSASLSHIFLLGGSLFGTTKGGQIYKISRSGKLTKLGNIGEAVSKMISWNNRIIVRGSSGRLWTSYKNGSPQLWKKDRQAGNYITKTKGSLWLAEYNKISKIRSAGSSEESDGESSTSGGAISLQDISNKSIPNSKSLLLPIHFKNDVSLNDLKITYQSPDIKNAEVRGLSFYWNPTTNDVGQHRVKIIATNSSGQTDSTSFTIDISSYNAPPRFAPVRTVTTAIGESFSLPITATDPDGTDHNLIRFLGVNLPKGASINETTGKFSWTPSVRQAGKNTFRVIATDQYGAAASKDITIKVVNDARRSTESN